MAGMGVGCVPRDAVIAHEFSQGLLYGLHAIGAAGFDVGSELMVVSTANQIADCAGGHEDFNGRIPVNSIDGRQEPLMNDGQEGE
jgi:hypothetical protein